MSNFSSIISSILPQTIKSIGKAIDSINQPANIYTYETFKQNRTKKNSKSSNSKSSNDKKKKSQRESSYAKENTNTVVKKSHSSKVEVKNTVVSDLNTVNPNELSKYMVYSEIFGPPMCKRKRGR